MSKQSRWLYLPVEGAELFTVVCLPVQAQTCPVLLYRTPYVDEMETMGEEEICRLVRDMHSSWLESGYAVVFQHCRGRGKSTGDCIPYIYEREDSLALQAWVRTQPFYQGELYLYGRSYSSSVHFVTAPFADDVKGAVLAVQDSQRYNANYRNGFYKPALHGEWYVGMYKKKSLRQKAYVPDSFRMLPLCDFSQTVFGEKAESFDEVLRHPSPDDPFWLTRFGGGEARDALQHVRIPVLLVTGFYDIYTGGIVDMWNSMDDEARSCCALAVSPYGHSREPGEQPVFFENGIMEEVFGDYPVRWMNAVRGREAWPFEPGKVTYYCLFGEGWRTDHFVPSASQLSFTLGEGERTYRYNPYAPASFKGGLSANFGGAAWQDAPGSRYDILTFYTSVFKQDVHVRGKMKAQLCVRSSCEDTCFYVRISLAKEQGDYGLRDDIQQLSNVCPDYVPGNTQTVDFSFDEHSFVIRAGERLRIDVSSSAYPLYVPHTNQRGLYAEQTTARTADNTVICDLSTLTVPIEQEDQQHDD